MVKSRKKLDFWFWVKVLVVGFMLIFLFYPFCTLITRSFFSKNAAGFTLENYIRFFNKKYYYNALGRSLFVSVVTTLTTLVVGVPIAYVMSRYNVVGKRFIHIFIIMSLMSPPFIGAYSWITLFGRSGFITSLFANIGIHLSEYLSANWVLLSYLPLSSSPMCTCTRQGPWEALIPAWRRLRRIWEAISCAGCGPLPCRGASIHCSRSHYGIHDQPG